MKFSITWLGATALILAALSGCGGGGGGGDTTPPLSGALGEKIAAAAKVAANDTSTNSSSAFKVLQDNGVPAVVVPASGSAKVNFTVISDGAVKTGLVNTNARIAVAKLVPGTNGEIDQWVSYIYRIETTTGSNNVGSGPGGTPALVSAKQATTDSSTAASLVYNPEGYYTYTLTTNIKDPTKTQGVVFEPNRTHRVAIQLSYTNAAGQTVLVNPYFDITFDANGNAVAVTDPNKTRVMADVGSCNGCHERLALHGGGRVDVQFCVMCHNPGTTDANSGNVLTMQTMVHKIHAGKLLAAATGGEDYVIWGFNSTKVDFAEVGFPQDLRNCTVCHTGANPKTPQGDNWKMRSSKESCLTCHANKVGSSWHTSHIPFANSIVGPNAAPKDIPNPYCDSCHAPGTSVAPERVHWNQNEENSVKYKVNIDSATYDPAARKVTIKYFLSDPTNNNAAYNLVTPDCVYPAPTVCQPPSGTNTTKFGNLRFYIAYQNMVGQSTNVTEFTAYNNGGSGASAYLYRGTNDGANKYTIDITLPADTASAVAAGTARIIGIGQVKEPKLEAKSEADPRPQVTPTQFVNVVVQHTYKDFAISGALNPRRQVVANEKCNVCHGALGTTSGSNTLAEAFHSGARNTVEACALCHDVNRVSSTVMTNGLALNESYQFKRMIHGIHGNSRRTYPFTHGNVVQGPFNKTGTLLAAGSFLADQKFTINSVSKTVIAAGTPIAAGATFQSIADVMNAAATSAGYTGTPVTPAANYAAEVAYPDVGVSCNLCHVNDSYKTDRSSIGAVVFKPLVGSPPAADTNPLNWKVISPLAASCTACHDSPPAIEHVTGFGNASFGSRSQADSINVQETCVDCHASGRSRGVDVVHGLK